MLALLSNTAAIHMLPNWTVGVQLIVFIGALGILSRYIFKPMLRIMDMRHSVTQGAKDESDKINTEAAELEEKRVRLLRKALSAFQDERARRISEARIKSEKMILDTRQESQWFLETSDMFIEASEESIAEEMASRADLLAKDIADRVIND